MSVLHENRRVGIYLQSLPFHPNAEKAGGSAMKETREKVTGSLSNIFGMLEKSSQESSMSVRTILHISKRVFHSCDTHPATGTLKKPSTPERHYMVQRVLHKRRMREETRG